MADSKTPEERMMERALIAVFTMQIAKERDNIAKSFGFRLLQQAMKDRMAERIMLCISLNDEAYDAFENFAAAELDREANLENTKEL